MSSIKVLQEINYKSKKIFVYELCCADGTKAVISNYGCILMKLMIKDRANNFRDTVLGFDSIEDYWNDDYLRYYPYFGAVMGRYVNRIKGARFSVDDKPVYLTANKGNNTLHGGAEGFDKKNWDVVEIKDTAQPTITMQLISPDGEEGFPGTLTTRITFSLLDSSFQYHIEATTDSATAVNLSYHPYFNLDKSHRTIATQQVKIYADHWLEQDDDFCATGRLIAVNHSPYDFRDWNPVAQQWNKEDGYDQTFIVAKNNGELSIVAEALSSDEVLHLQVLSNEPAVHFYSGKWIPSLIGKNKEAYRPFSGYCFETHHHPDAVNIPDFPNTILRPGDLYKQTTIYRFQ